MAGIDSLQALLEDELKDIYDAERQITRALPKMIKKASAEELRSAFEEHLHQTELQVKRLEQVFDQLELPARGKKCLGMQYLIKEGEEMIAEAEDEATCDALMIAAAQKIEHYEIASYGTLRVWAALLGHDESAALFEQTLEEEKETDSTLTSIAESFVNQAAAKADGSAAEAAPNVRAGSRSRGGVTGGARQQAADRGGSTSRTRGRKRAARR